MKNWLSQILPIINEYKDGDTEPLNNASVDVLCNIIKAKINLQEGNITDAQYETILDNLHPKYVYVMVGNEDATSSFTDLGTDATDEAKEEFFEDYAHDYEVGKYRTDLLDLSLLKSIEDWGSYIILSEEQYNFLR